MADIKATWSISLNCDCPKCGEYVDLLEDPDWWDRHRVELCEHDTPKTTDVRVICPDCGADFHADFQY